MSTLSLYHLLLSIHLYGELDISWIVVIITHYICQALGKNGKVFGNGIMVGVQRCVDKVCMCVHVLMMGVAVADMIPGGVYKFMYVQCGCDRWH